MTEPELLRHEHKATTKLLGFPQPRALSVARSRHTLASSVCIMDNSENTTNAIKEERQTPLSGEKSSHPCTVSLVFPGVFMDLTRTSPALPPRGTWGARPTPTLSEQHWLSPASGSDCHHSSLVMLFTCNLWQSENFSTTSLAASPSSAKEGWFCSGWETVPPVPAEGRRGGKGRSMHPATLKPVGHASTDATAHWLKVPVSLKLLVCLSYMT